MAGKNKRSEGLEMKYKGTLIAVKDMEKAKQFYNSVLELEVVMDAGANVELTGGVFLQTADTWIDFRATCGYCLHPSAGRA